MRAWQQVRLYIRTFTDSILTAPGSQHTTVLRAQSRYCILFFGRLHFSISPFPLSIASSHVHTFFRLSSLPSLCYPQHRLLPPSTGHNITWVFSWSSILQAWRFTTESSGIMSLSSFVYMQGATESVCDGLLTEEEGETAGHR